MIQLAQKKLVINCPVTQVFSYVTNMENYKDWFPGVAGIRSFNNLGHAEVGKQYLEALCMPQGDVDLIIEVIQVDKQRFFMTQGDLQPLQPQMTINFSQIVEKSCEIELSYFSRNMSLKADDELITGLSSDLSNRADDGLNALKRILESI